MPGKRPRRLRLAGIHRRADPWADPLVRGRPPGRPLRDRMSLIWCGEERVQGIHTAFPEFVLKHPMAQLTYSCQKPGCRSQDFATVCTPLTSTLRPQIADSAREGLMPF